MDFPYLKKTLLENFLENRHLTQNDFRKIYNKVSYIYEQEINLWKQKCEKLEKENIKMKKVMDSDISSSIQSGFEKMQNVMANGGPIPRMFSIVIDPNKSDGDLNAGKNQEKIRQESVFLENLKSHILKETNNEIEKKNNDNLKKIFMDSMNNDKNSFFIGDSIINNPQQDKNFKVFNPFDYGVPKVLENKERKRESTENNVIDKMINKNKKSIDLANFFDKTMKIANDKNKNANDLFTLWKEQRDIAKDFMSEDDWKIINKKINSM